MDNHKQQQQQQDVGVPKKRKLGESKREENFAFTATESLLERNPSQPKEVVAPMPLGEDVLVKVKVEEKPEEETDGEAESNMKHAPMGEEESGNQQQQQEVVVPKKRIPCETKREENAAITVMGSLTERNPSSPKGIVAPIPHGGDIVVKVKKESGNPKTSDKDDAEVAAKNAAEKAERAANEAVKAATEAEQATVKAEIASTTAAKAATEASNTADTLRRMIASMGEIHSM